MKPTITSITFALLCLAFSFIDIYKMNTNIAVGYTEGQFNVNEAGGANYTIPIKVPKGTGGIQPNLSISYSSLGGSGFLGQGFALQGLSTITRSNRTIAQDGYTQGVSLTNTDAFNFDGERITVISGTYGGDGSEYRTEQNAFVKIKSYGNINGAPEKFKVWAKDGSVMEYGYTTDSRIEASGKIDVLLWAINKITDTKGNYIEFSYFEDNANGEYRPQRIDYTGNATVGLSPYNSVEFQYIPCPNVKTQYLKGVKIQSNHLLSKVITKHGNLIHRSYELSYSNSPITNSPLLQNIQECGQNNTCFPATTFDWKSEKVIDFASTPVTNSIPTNDLTGIQNQLLTGDFDGDGMTDMLRFDPTTGNNKFYQNSSNYTFTTTIKNNPIPTLSLINGSLSLSDFNADGFTDLLWLDPVSGINRWFINNGNAFSNLSFTVYNNSIPVGELAAVNNEAVKLFFADFNGDGRTDVMTYLKSSGKNRFFLNQGVGSTFSFNQVATNSLLQETLISGGTELIVTDWDRDGLADIFHVDNTTGSNHFFINNYNTNLLFSSPFTDQISTTLLQGDSTINSGDFNGDGLLDLMSYKTSDGTTKFFYNKGDVTFSQATHQLPSSYISTTSSTAQLLVFDFNGDRFSDLLYYDKANGKNHFFQNDGACDFSKPLNVNASSTPGFLNPINTNQITNGTIQLGGLSEKGMIDFLWYDNTNGTNRIFKNIQETANLVKKITNGLGHQTTVQYTPLTVDSVYIKENSAIYPVYDLQASFYVVSSYTISNGVNGGSNKYSYCYKGAKMNLEGRGFRGFTEVHIQDHAKEWITKNFYRKDHRFIGSPLVKTTIALENGTVIFENTYSHDLKKFGYGLDTIYFSYVNQSIQKSFELNGNLISSIENRQDYDNYGNIIYKVSETNDGYIDSVYNTYNNNVNTWILGRLIRSNITQKATGQPTIYRSIAFQYDANGLLIQEIKDPDLGNQVKIVKDYQYNNFGNRIQTTTTAWNGNALESRNVFTTYDAQGRFVTTISNDLGHTSSQQQDPVFGSVISEMDANGLTANYELDELGRYKKKNLPNGNWESYTYAFDTLNPNLQNATFTKHTQATFQKDRIEYFDVLNRKIQEETAGFDSTSILTTLTFNTKGELVKSSEPYYNGQTIKETVNEYDLLGRPTKHIAPGNRTTLITYNGLSSTEMNPAGQVRTTVKNTKGNIVSVMDNMTNVTLYKYDAAKRLKRIIYPNGDFIENNYNIQGNLTTTVDPNIGLYQYFYNSFGELTKQINSKGSIIEIERDILGRETTRYEQEDSTYTVYDNSPYAIGKPISITNSNHTKTFAYDSLSRPISTIETIDGTPYITNQTFNQKGLLEYVVYPSNFTIKYKYNDQYYLESVENGITGQVYHTIDEKDARNQTTKQTFGNGLQTTHVFNNNTGTISSIQTYQAGNPTNLTQNLSYTYNVLNNLTSRTNHIQNKSEHFSYDALNRLNETRITGGDTISINYDVMGNITHKSDVGNYTYGQNGKGAHILTSISSNQTSCIPSSLVDIDYYSFDKVKSLEKEAERLNLFYGVDKKRIIQKHYNDDVLYKTKIHIGQLYERIVTDTLTTELFYIRGEEGTIGVHEVKSNGQTTDKYWQKDHLGSIHIISDAVGQVVEELNYDAWGARRNADWTPVGEGTTTISSSCGCRGFTTHEHIDLFSLINMNGRIYDPVIGRFISPDPFIQDPTNLQSLNRYAYVHNNPLNLVDPSGFFAKKLWRKVKSFVSNVASKVEQAVTEVKDKVEEVIGSAANIDFGSSAVGTFLSNLNILALAAGFKGTVSDAVSNVKKKVGDVWNDIKEGVEEVVDKVDQTITDIGQTLEEIGDKIKDGAEEALETVKEIIADVKDGINQVEDFIDNFKDEVEELFDGETSFNLPNILMPILDNTIQGDSWDNWGRCATGIGTGIIGGAIKGAGKGSKIPIIGKVGGAIIGGIFGGISGGSKYCQ